MREAIEGLPTTRFERAHFKKYGETAPIFAAAFYFDDPDYNQYMDAQQAINLGIHQRLQEEGIAPVRSTQPTPVDDLPQGGEETKSRGGIPARDVSH